MTPVEALQKAINIIGGQQALADYCGVRQQTISDWLRNLGRVPAERVLQVEKACKRKVTRHHLRPDIYPRGSTIE